MSDRVCIHSNGTLNFHFSAEDLVSCCSSCGFGCNGGFPGAAWSYWVKKGIVSGGSYDSHQVIKLSTCFLMSLSNLCIFIFKYTRISTVCTFCCAWYSIYYLYAFCYSPLIYPVTQSVLLHSLNVTNRHVSRHSLKVY